MRDALGHRAGLLGEEAAQVRLQDCRPAQPHGRGVVGFGLVVLAVAGIGKAARDVPPGVFGVEADRLVVVGNGLVEIALAQVGRAADVVRREALGVEGQRRVAIADGLVEPPPFRIHLAAEPVGRGGLGLQADGRRDVGKGLVEVALGVVFRGAVG